MLNEKQVRANAHDTPRHGAPGVRSVIAGGLVGLGFAIGSLTGEANPVVASTGSSDVVIKDRLQIPALTIPKDGAAIIGASDDLYYIVRTDGTTAVLTGMRREDLCWRRPDER